MESFIDEAQITVVGGAGGGGIVSFLREKSRPFGGPNGGNGGRGGSVIAVADGRVNTLAEYQRRRRVAAKNGGRGQGKKRNGGDGDDIVLSFPIGTKIIDADTARAHADLTADGGRIVLANGGRGGLGNTCFKSSTHRAPRICTDGQAGEVRRFILELRILADVGLLGLPNAGKSTFLRAVSAAKPKVGDYPFTTLAPHLGYVAADDGDGDGVIIADIPGLIQGAANGAGLGNRFLRHLSRTRLLCQVVDGGAPDPPADCLSLLEELSQASAELFAKPRWLVINKIDLLPKKIRRRPMPSVHLCENYFERVFAVSALSGEGIAPLVRALLKNHEKTSS